MAANRNRLVIPFLALALVLAGPVLAGSIKGTVKFEGKVPPLKPMDMNADPGCAKKHGTPPASEMLVLGDGNTVANIFVQVKSGVPQKAYPVPKEPAVIDQHGCRYVPHVLGVMVGQPVKILNSDGLLHNIHALPTVNKSFNKAMPASVTESVETFDKAEGMFKIKCDVHPWMGAWISVMTHPFFDVTEKDGQFTIGNLPAGTYEIEAWHEKMGTKTSKVTIGADETKGVDFTFTPPQGS